MGFTLEREKDVSNKRKREATGRNTCVVNIWSAPASLTNSLCSQSTFFALLCTAERGVKLLQQLNLSCSAVIKNQCDQLADKCDYSAEQLTSQSPEYVTSNQDNLLV
jgi:hypothetical protein